MSKEILSLYQMTPEVYDQYMCTQIEKRNFDEVFKKLQDKHDPSSLTHVLDLCCGTGIFLRKWLTGLERITYSGVDINPAFLDFARDKLGEDPNYDFVEGDASNTTLDKMFDIVLSTSAYHHIVDEEKRKFLENIRKHLKKDGRGIIYEKFVAPFTDPIKAARSGTLFYAERIFDMMQEEELSDAQLFALYNEMYLTSVRKEEYKVPFNRFKEDLEATGLRIEEKVKLWPQDNRFQDLDIGDFVVTIKHS